MADFYKTGRTYSKEGKRNFKRYTPNNREE